MLPYVGQSEVRGFFFHFQAVLDGFKILLRLVDTYGRNSLLLETGADTNPNFFALWST